MAAFVQETGTEGTGTTITRTLTVTAGNTLVAFIRGQDIGGLKAVSSVADNVNGSWGAAIGSNYTPTTGEIGALLYRKANCGAGSTTVTVTFATAIDGSELVVAEFSGLATSSDTDQNNSNDVASNTSHSCGSITTTGGTGGVILTAGALNDGITPTAAAGFTLLTTGGRFVAQYKISSGNETTTATYTTDNAANSENCIANLKNASGGATTAKRSPFQSPVFNSRVLQ